MKRILVSILLAVLLLTGCSQKDLNDNVPVSTDTDTEQPSYQQIDGEQALLMMQQDDGHVIVDVRRQDEFDAGHIPGAICIPNESIGSEQPNELPDLGQIILIYCRSGNRSKQAAEKLAALGYRNLYEFGGILDWTGDIVAETAPVSSTEPYDYAGSYENANLDSVIIAKQDNGYAMEITLFRLASFPEGTVFEEADRLVFHTIDAQGDPMTLSFVPNQDRYTLRVEESTWPLLEQGTVITGFQKQPEA